MHQAACIDDFTCFICTICQVAFGDCHVRYTYIYASRLLHPHRHAYMHTDVQYHHHSRLKLPAFRPSAPPPPAPAPVPAAPLAPPPPASSCCCPGRGGRPKWLRNAATCCSGCFSGLDCSRGAANTARPHIARACVKSLLLRLENTSACSRCNSKQPVMVGRQLTTAK
jgi:hypothetical protein